MAAFDFTSYVSPFTWRYGSSQMRQIFSESNKYKIWRKIWVTVASAQHSFGLVSVEELNDLKKYQNEIDIQRILELEKETKHDVVAAIKEFAQKATIGGGKIHMGLTSMDVVDNAEVLRMKEALNIIKLKLLTILTLLREKIETYAQTPCLGYTHLQPAEPTTVGYRFAFYAQDLLEDLQLLDFMQKNLKGKGIKGAVGTQASFKTLFETELRVKNEELKMDRHINNKVFEMEKEIMQTLEIEPVEVSTQVYSRKQDFLIVSLLASISASIAKFAADLRILQFPGIGEWSEPFEEKQVGSSAMPFKKNPINSEKICSLSRMVSSMPLTMLENATHSYLERTLDDSANKRVIIPEAFLTVDEILDTAQKILSGMTINTEKISYNLHQYAPFVASEGILMQATKNGANRQAMHETLREMALHAWKNVQEGKDNPMQEMLEKNEEIKKYLSKEQIEKLVDVTTHIGTAPDRAKKIAEKVKKVLA